jgi:hypothetical protein
VDQPYVLIISAAIFFVILLALTVVIVLRRRVRARLTQNGPKLRPLWRRPAHRALVIGLSDYENAIQFGALPGAEADAKDFADLLEDTYGFFVERVIGGRDEKGLHIDLHKRRNHFVSQSKNAEVVIVYFAGHGIRYDLNTFLVPTFAAMDDGPPSDFLGRCLECNTLMGFIMSELPKSARKIFIFDCCRSDAQRHLKQDPLYQPPSEPQFSANELILFGTALNKTARDDKNTFTQELIADLTDTTRPFVESLRRACERVSTKKYEHAPHIRHAR